MANTEKDNCGCGFIANIYGKATHRLIEQSLVALQRHTHRGAVDEDGLSADGCGLLLQLPRSFFQDYAQKNKLALDPFFAVGMCFLNPNAVQCNKDQVSDGLKALGFSVVAWRDLAVNNTVCGAHAEKNRPHIAQVILNLGEKSNVEAIESNLMLARHRISMALIDDPFFYICSLSTQVIVYKALVLPQYLPIFYPDLQNKKFRAAFCIFHQRFSTNTLPAWRLAQPFRFLAHNGEINTIQGNRHAAYARSKLLNSHHYPELDSMRPIVSFDGSDSASLDNMLEFLIRAGMDFFQAIRLLIPPAWQNISKLPPEQKAFYDYFSTQMEPWDGPASLLFTDGKKIACALDRNGFRPARYMQTSDDLVIVSSEAGAVDIPLEKITHKGKVGPGQLLAVDLQSHTVLLTEEIDEHLSKDKPYFAWIKEQTIYLPLENHQKFDVQIFTTQELKFYRKLFDVSYEEINELLKVMAQTAKEATFSMGDDTPIAALSTKNRPLFDYFRQQFAQVTNPPMDSLRESFFMSLETTLGKHENLFHLGEDHARRVCLSSPVLSSEDLSALVALPDFPLTKLSLGYLTNQTLEQALDELCNKALDAVKNGKILLLLTDKTIEKDAIPMHPLIAVGAIHHALIEAGVRYDCDLIIESGWVRDAHHCAALIAYGAAAICPYLAYSLIQEINVENGLKNYVKALENGLLKICSKMGISTINSYRGSQLFEIIGLSDQVVKRCFSQSAAKLALLDFSDLDALARAHFDNAHNPYSEARHGGLLKYIPGGEYHDFNPDAVMVLLEAAKRGDEQLYRQFSQLIQQRPQTTIRDLLAFNTTQNAIPIDKVECVEAIFPRFETAAMSLGALSPEAHEALAVAMNTIGGRSNSGEGGEASYRHNSLKTSKIKQVASGRFGVTAEYLMNAEVIQIKMAQGAKPGEGGQLPGNKVNQMIASLRYCAEGVTLISPPPHHDIYSIEDLAQLIFDLKQINPNALVSVKLVAGPGIGTIAAGVVKAYADMITISGYDGGTGASPASSIKYTGSPWELGLQETQQVLLENNLRHRVILQVDGGFKTGFDVVKAAMMGAESFGFGTAPMVALGCKYLRICHLNNCATGLATQDDYLREHHYQGSAQRVINYFTWVAQEVREILASLGFSRLNEVIGRVDLLKKIESQDPFIKKLDLSFLLTPPQSTNQQAWLATSKSNKPRDEARLAETIQQAVEPLLLADLPIKLHYAIQNCDRSIGAKLAGYVTKQYGMRALEADRIQLHFNGSAGQSFGAWNCQGMKLHLTGEANDYVGKGMNGGKIVIVPSVDAIYPSYEAVIAGNTCLYGATGGVCYMAGAVGERFAVRNSGALAVVEAVGAHCCEYMTGGVVVVLGETGMNFGAGMTGGIAFVLDINGHFPNRYNKELISIHRLSEPEAAPFAKYLADILQDYRVATGSELGSSLCKTFNDSKNLFWLIKPTIINWDNLLNYETK